MIGGDWVQRAYTLTSPAGQTDHYEISVKKEEKGVFSNWIHENFQKESIIRVTKPHGKFYLDEKETKPTICICAGIGMTPFLAMIRTFAKNNDPNPSSPGMLGRHYAPSTPLRLNALSAKESEVLLGFGPTSDDTEFNLSESGNLVEAAANLFAMLRALDAVSPTCIAVMPIPLVGLGLAINDRLRRAAAPLFELSDT